MPPDPNLSRMAAMVASTAAARAALKVHLAGEIYAMLAISIHEDSEVVDQRAALDEGAAYALRAADRFVAAVEGKRT